MIVRILTLIAVMMPLSVNAIERIDINRGVVEPMPIAISSFTSESSEGKELGNNITNVITNDLESSGLFRALDKQSFIENITDGRKQPDYPSWRQLSIPALVSGHIINKGSESEIEFRLWDVFLQQQMSGSMLVTKSANWRRAAHMIADEIYKRLTGEEGYFDTRIVYVAESGASKTRIKRLAIMDYDGENHKFLTDGNSLVLTPRFSPESQKILYMSYAKKMPRVLIRDIESGKERVLGDFPGMTFAPRFAPSGNRALLSMAKDGVTNIYEIDIHSMNKKAITNTADIDTSPSYSPDETKIVFNSDRGGKPQLYVMNSDGSNPHRISFGDGRYATPVWSPRGDLIAFTKWGDGTGMFYIGVMRPDGSGERLLASGYIVESPTWAPNGRVITYTKQERGGKSRIHSIDLTGHNERELITPTDASDPAWSPLLK
jgi:TolB protein